MADGDNGVLLEALKRGGGIKQPAGNMYDRSETQGNVI